VQRSQNPCQHVNFLQFLLHIFMWCHFSGMLIMESCAYSLIWILRNLKYVKKSYVISFWLKQRMFNSFIQWYDFHKGPPGFYYTISLILNFKKVIGYYYTHIKSIQIFILKKLCLWKTMVFKKFMNPLQHVNVMQYIYCLKKSCSL